VKALILSLPNDHPLQIVIRTYPLALSLSLGPALLSFLASSRTRLKWSGLRPQINSTARVSTHQLPVRHHRCDRRWFRSAVSVGTSREEMDQGTSEKRQRRRVRISSTFRAVAKNLRMQRARLSYSHHPSAGSTSFLSSAQGGHSLSLRRARSRRHAKSNEVVLLKPLT
jgi:hypothetical protein